VRRLLIIAILATPLLPNTVRPEKSDRPSVAMLRPPEGSAVVAPSGEVEIAVISPEGAPAASPSLDGEALRSAAFSASMIENQGGINPTSSSEVLRIAPDRLAEGLYIPPVWVAVRRMKPGKHELRIGGKKVCFTITSTGAKDSATSTTPFVPHPPAARGLLTCTGCHRLDRRANPPRFTDMGGADEPETPDVCFRCHNRLDFADTHQHRIEHLAFCQMCHDPHGSDRPDLMRLPREKACKQCHE